MSEIKLYPEPKEGEKITIKTFRCSNALRWRRPSDDEITALIEATHGKHAPVLQQAWECLETGEVEWHDVPIEAPNAPAQGCERSEHPAGA